MNPSNSHPDQQQQLSSTAAAAAAAAAAAIAGATTTATTVLLDVEQIHVLLQQTFVPDATIRQPAEEYIRHLKHIPGSTVLLLQVASEKQVRFEVRQAAAIQLKNICREGWAERAQYNSHGILNGSNNTSTLLTTTAAIESGVAQQQQLQEQPPPKSSSLLSQEDKDAVKVGLVHALLNEHEKSVRDLLAETLQTIVIHDFPERWDSLIPTLLYTIQLGIQQAGIAIPLLIPMNVTPATTTPSITGLQIHNALLAIRKVTKRYEYKSKEQRGPLNDIVQQAFPLLLPLGQHLSNPQYNQHSLEVAMMLKQILKIFWSSTQFYLPGAPTTSTSNNTTTTPTNNDTSIVSTTTNTNNNGETNHSSSTSGGLARPEQLQPWFDILTNALWKPLPEASTGLEPVNQPVDIDARNAWPWWKVKKWAVQIMSRLFSRYGIPNYADDAFAKEFAIYFSKLVAPQFLEPIFYTLNLRPTGQFCTDRVVHLCISFVDLAVELASTYQLIKPKLDFLLYNVCFPTMCLNDDDIDCFNNDAVEFVHKQSSPLADFYDPRMSAITLITDLVKHRGQDVTLKLLSTMKDILNRYAITPLEQQNHVEMDGALLTFGSLAKYLMAKDKYAKEVESLLLTSVFPAFNSPIPFLRYRACWMVQQFSNSKFSDDGSNLRTLLQMVLQRLSDPALPVQIEASKALRFLIEADGAEDTLLPVLPQLLNEYFRIMNEIGNDEVVSALQVLLDKFGDHIEPHAIVLVTKLSEAFNQYCTAGEDDDDDDAALAAAQCLECIATVLKGICAKESILKSLEPILLPLVLKILGNDGEFIEYLESALDILTFLTYFQETISPEIWQTFPLIYMAFDQWAYDYLNMMVPCLQSYIAKAPDIFLTGTAQLPEGNVAYLDVISNMVAKTVSNDRASEPECRYALSLLMCILHNCPHKVDGYLYFINEVALGKLGQQVNEDTPTTRISIYQVIGSAFYYNPQLEILELENRGVTQQVLYKWISDTEKIERWLPRKLTVLGLTSILTIPKASLPESISSLVPHIIHTVSKIALALKADTEKGETDAKIDEENEDAVDEDDDEQIGDLEQGFDENEDVKNEVDEAYRKALQGTNWDDDMQQFLCGDWEENGEDVDEDYTSPIDQVDELIYLNDTLIYAFQREPEAYLLVQQNLPPESVTNCQTIFTTARLMRAQQAAQQATQQS